MTPLQEELAPQVRTMQIIVAGLTLSPIVFAATVLLIDVTPLQKAPAALLANMCLGLGVLGLITHAPVDWIVRRQSVNVIAKQGRNDPSALGGAYMSGLLFSLAMTEGAAFMNLFGYMSGQSTICLAMAALLLAINIMKLPTLAKVERWVLDETKRLEELSAFNK